MQMEYPDVGSQCQCVDEFDEPKDCATSAAPLDFKLTFEGDQGHSRKGDFETVDWDVLQTVLVKYLGVDSVKVG